MFAYAALACLRGTRTPNAVVGRLMAVAARLSGADILYLSNVNSQPDRDDLSNHSLTRLEENTQPGGGD